MSIRVRVRVVRDGIDVVTRSLLLWRRARERLSRIYFDEIASVAPAERALTLRDGRVVAVESREHADAIARALSPPRPTPSLEEARVQWRAWLAGPRCARRAARALVDAARALDATDVHIEPAGAHVAVRMRIDGELCELVGGGGGLDSDGAAPIIAALKGLAGCLAYRRDIAQEGRIDSGDAVAADVRASFVPTVLGERVALRLFGRLRSLDELGFDDDTARSLRALLEAPSGLVVVAGASGAGKTTTLYALLAALARSRAGRAHVSLEDPVEQRLRLAGVAVDQLELDPARGLTADSMLAATLRQDVDVVAVGEVRTPAEARLAVHAAHTGRLVLCGVHAGSAREGRRRLLDLLALSDDNGARTELDATLRAVLHQELVSVVESDGARRRRARGELWTPTAAAPAAAAVPTAALPAARVTQSGGVA